MIFMFMAVGAGARALSSALDLLHMAAQAKRYKKLAPMIESMERARREEVARQGHPVSEPLELIIVEPRPRLYGSKEEQQRARLGDTRAIGLAERRFVAIADHLEKCTRCGKVVTDPMSYHSRA